MEQRYESPFKYQDGIKRVEGAVLDKNCISTYREDGTLSTLDLAIMEILYRQHFASRSMIEDMLVGYQVRMPRDLRRTLRHLFQDGILYGYVVGGNVRFYALSDSAVRYMQENGSETLYEYGADVPDTVEVIKSLAYSQLEEGLISTFGESLLSKSRHYQIYGIDGNLTVDGYLELESGTSVHALFVYVARRNAGWQKEASDWYGQLSHYTLGQGATVLFLCEDGGQVIELSEVLQLRYGDSMPERYFTHDTLILSSQCVQHVIVCESGTMRYGTLHV